MAFRPVAAGGTGSLGGRPGRLSAAAGAGLWGVRGGSGPEAGRSRDQNRGIIKTEPSLSPTKVTYRPSHGAPDTPAIIQAAPESAQSRA